MGQHDERARVPEASCGAAIESSPRREPWDSRQSAASPGGATEGCLTANKILPPRCGSPLWCAYPTAHAVGYYLTRLRRWSARAFYPLISTGLQPGVEAAASESRFNGFAGGWTKTVETVLPASPLRHPAEARC